MTDDDHDHDHEHEHQQPLNREQRRAQKYRPKASGRQDNLHTQRENNTGFLSGPADTLADGPNETALEASSTPGSMNHGGPGTGGETESADRAEHHEGTHRGNPSKS